MAAPTCGFGLFEDPDYQPACRWDGNVQANSIQGVLKPRAALDRLEE